MERRRLQCGLTLDVATTEAEWQKGLSGITEWGDLDGMLFVFPVSKRWPVYMHEMSCSLNAYWLSHTGHVVARVWMPQESSVYYLPVMDARYLIETRMPMGWDLAEQIQLEAYDPTRSPNADLGTVERLDNQSAVLEYHPD